MQRKLVVRGSLLCIALALVILATTGFMANTGAIASHAPAKSADEKFAELYSTVQIGMDPDRSENAPIMSRSRSLDEGDFATIVSILRAQMKDPALGADPNESVACLWLPDRREWLSLMTSKAIEWRKWEHPTDRSKWFAAGRIYNTGGYKIICKVKVG